MTSDQLKTLDQDQYEALRARAREDFFFFAKGILGYSKLNKRVHGPLCRKLEDFSQKRKRIILPRGWFKTTLITISWSIWLSIRDPDITILVAQNTTENALAKLEVIRSQWEQNELLRALFPELVPDSTCVWKQGSYQIRRTKASAESTYEAAGIKKQVVSRHYDVIIEDDTVAPDLDEIGEDNMVPTKEDIDKAIGWHKLAVPLLRDQKNCMIVVVGTRWFEKDLLSWVGDNEPYYDSYTRACREDSEGNPDPDGEPTFPEEFDEEVLNRLKLSMGPYMYSCLYMNKPMSSSDMTFKAEWFQYYEELPSVSKSRLLFWTTCDPSGSPEDLKSTRNDPAVVLTCAKDLSTGQGYVVQVTEGRWTPAEFIDVIFDHVERWSPVKVGIEATAYQHTVQFWVREQQVQRRKRFQVEPIRYSTRSKEARIRALQPPIYSGSILFAKSHAKLVNQLLSFPLGEYDDLADALAMQLDLWRASSVPEIKAEPDLGFHPLSVRDVIEEQSKPVESGTPGSLADVNPFELSDLDMTGI